MDKSTCVRHPKGQYINQDWINIKSVAILRNGAEAFERLSIEDCVAKSFQVNKASLIPYSELVPRSVSILPIAKGCQAKCPFCFSKGSVSNDIAQANLSPEYIDQVLLSAKARGAQRAVITGGGEPTMLPFPKLLALVRQCSVFDNVCLITNGYSLAQLDETERIAALCSLDAAGLTVLSVSRHAVSDEDNARIMYLDTKSSVVAKSWTASHSAGMLRRLTRMRWVCVLQRGGVDSQTSLSAYLDFVADSGVPEICFKELYVSTSAESLYHDAASNKWALENQVPLSLVISFCDNNGFSKISELPWGAPVFEGLWRGKSIRIAAYTEPSVFWERSHGLCRSWNVMADKSVLASLEDKNSNVMSNDNKTES